MVTQVPDRDNIKFFKITVLAYDLKMIFKDVINDMSTNGYSAQCVLVFCRTMKNIYLFFHELLKDKHVQINIQIIFFII